MAHILLCVPVLPSYVSHCPILYKSPQIITHLASRNNTPLFRLDTPNFLHGTFVKVGGIIAPPYVCDRTDGGFAGVDIDVLEATGTALNFSVVYILSEDLRKENESEDTLWRGRRGPWNTILLRLESGEIDIGVGGFFLTPERIAALGYIHPYGTDSSQFFATQDLITSNKIGIWIGFVVVLMVLGNI